MKTFLTSIVLATSIAATPLVMAAPSQAANSNQYSEIAANSVSNPLAQSRLKQGKIVVTEFFSYGCPACNYVANDMRAWSDKLPADVEFNRVPVAFFKGWDDLARAYYVAESLGVLEDVDKDIFNAIHKEKIDLTKKENQEKFFAARGVDKDKFNKAYDSFAVNRSMERGKMLMQVYKVFAVPTVIVDNKYSTDLQKAGGKDELITIVNELVDKQRKSIEQAKSSSRADEAKNS